MVNAKSAIRFEKMLDEGGKIAIISHFNPDGDAVGAITGLRNYLSGKGIPSKIILPSHIPAYLQFLDPKHTICFYADAQEKAKKIIAESDTIVCLDFSGLSRTEWLADYIAASKAKKILIDHHLAPETENFDFVISDISASSTCEILFWTILRGPYVNNDVMKLSKETLLSLATGLITDTNNFNNSISSDTFMMASKIMKAGIDLSMINYKVFKNYSEKRMRLMGNILYNSMTLVHNGYASYIIITMQDKERYSLHEGDSEGFVNLPLSISGLEISALFTECKKYIRVSMRSKGRESVNDFCRLFFNGGGHEKASGGRLYMPLNEVPEYFNKSLEKFLQKEEK